MHRFEYAIKDLDFSNKTIFDCAIGAAESTYYWAKACHTAGGTSCITGFDLEFDNYTESLIEKNLNEYAKYVTLKEKDISELAEYESNSLDYINCDDTLVFLATKIGKIEKTLSGFYRLLKSDGQLIITSEVPIFKPTNQYEINQFERWNFAKAIFALKGEIWSYEPSLEEIKEILKNLHFEILEEKLFQSYKQENPFDCIEEWKSIMQKEILNNIKDKPFQISLLNEMERIYSNVLENGMACPGFYVLKCKK